MRVKKKKSKVAVRSFWRNGNNSTLYSLFPVSSSSFYKFPFIPSFLPSCPSHFHFKIRSKSSPIIMAAVIKVHGVPMSTATMRVLAALYEKDLQFELIPVDMRAGAHKQEPYLSLNVTRNSFISSNFFFLVSFTSDGFCYLSALWSSSCSPGR